MLFLRFFYYVIHDLRCFRRYLPKYVANVIVTAHVTSYLLATSKSSTSGFDSATRDNFNNFYARFDRQNSTSMSVILPEPACHSLLPSLHATPSSLHCVPPPPPDPVCHSVLPSLQEHEVTKLYKRQRSRKATDPDNVSTSTLKYSANELTPL